MSQVPVGVYFGDPNAGTFAAQYDSFLTFSGGRKPTIYTIFCDQSYPAQLGVPDINHGGGSNTYGWPQQADYALAGMAGQTRLAGVIPSLAVPFALQNSGTNYYAAITAGTYDSLIDGMLDAAKNRGFNSIYFRPGWEYQFQAWAPTAGTVSNFVAAMQHFYTEAHRYAAIISVTTKIIWNPNVATPISGVNPFSLTYPGDAFVDVLAVDSYGNGVDNGWAGHAPGDSNADPTQYWVQNMFAQSLSSGKPCCLPESGSSDAGFPNALIAALNARNSAIQVEFAAIWVDNNAAPGNNWAEPGNTNPSTAAAWMAGFGLNGTVVNVAAGGPGSPVITQGSTTLTSVALNWAAVTGNTPITYQVADRLTNPPLINSVGPTITDAQNNIWAINAAAKVTFNGSVVGFTAQVTAIEYVTGTMWQFGAGAWYNMGVSGGVVVDSSGGVGVSVDPKLTFVSVGSPVSGLTSTVSALQGNTSYDFIVTAANASGSAPSNVLTVVTSGSVVPPSAPTVTAGAITSSSVVLNWSASTGSSPITYQATFRVTNPPIVTTFGPTITDANNNVWRLVNSNGGQVTFNGTIIGFTGGVVEIAYVTGTMWQFANSLWYAFTATGGDASGGVGSATSPLPGAFTSFGSVISGFTTTVTGLAASTSYDFRTIATNSGGSATSATLTVSTTAVGTQVAPNAPGNLAATSPTTTTMNLAWTISTIGTPAPTYQPLFKLATDPTYTAFGTASANTSAVITGLSPGLSYNFEVVATNASGSATTAPVTNSTTPSAGQASLMLSWVASTTGTLPITYQPYYRVAGASTFLPFGSPILGTSVVVTGLVHTTNYEFDVVAINIAGSATSATAPGTTT